MKRKTKSKRGRKPGQLLKKHVDISDSIHHAVLAMEGDYSPGVTDFLKKLFLFTETRKVIEESANAFLKKQVEVLRNYGGERDLKMPALLPPVLNRDRAWRKKWRVSKDFLEWLQVFKGTDPACILTLLLDKIAKRDAKFFHDIARRLEDPQPLNMAPSSILFAVAMAKDDPDISQNPTDKELLNFIFTMTGRKPDRRTLRDYKRLVGFPVRNSAGRPQKPKK